MKVIDISCPKCGATLQVEKGKETLNCQYCGSELFIDKEQSSIDLDNAEQAGYAFEKGRQKAQQEINSQSTPISYASQQYSPTKTPSNDSKNSVDAPKKRKTWLWVLGWIFIFPIPLTILMLKSPRTENMNKKVRIAIVIAGWLLYLIIGFSGVGNNQNTNGANTNTNSQQVQTESKQVNSISECTTNKELETFLENNYYNQPLDKAATDLENAGYKAKYTNYSGKEIDISLIEPSVFLLDKASDINVKNKTLTLKYKDKEQDAQNAMEAQLQAKLDITNAVTAVEQYGNKEYIDFKLNPITGKIAERAEDADTWFIKYTCEYKNVYGTKIKDKTCEAKVTGTTDSPNVISFVVY